MKVTDLEMEASALSAAILAETLPLSATEPAEARAEALAASLTEIIIENQRLKGILYHSDPVLTGPEGTYERMLRTNPRFKSYCRRKTTTRMPTVEARIAAARKARAAEIKTFCKPRGPFSILKENEYWTGRLIKVGEGYPAVPETAKIRKLGQEWESELTDDGPDIIVVPQNVPDFGQDPIEPEDEIEPDQEPPDDEDSEEPTIAPALAKLLMAIQDQQALLRQLAAL